MPPTLNDALPVLAITPSPSYKTNLISVIIPCHQQGRFLKDAVESLLKQTYLNWEAIIVDDGSSDCTESICIELEHMDVRIRRIRQVHRGVSAARNAGIRESKGHFIQFLDADDCLESDKFEKQVNFLCSNRAAKIVYGGAKYFSDGYYGKFRNEIAMSQIEHEWIRERWLDPRPLAVKFVEHNLFPVCCPLIRREVIAEIGLFNESMRALEDWEYWLRCALAGIDIHFLEMRGTNCLIRTHPTSASQQKTAMKVAEFELRLACHDIIRKSGATATNLFILLNVCSDISQETRNALHQRILPICNNFRTRALVRFRRWLDNNQGAIAGIVFISRFLPKRIFRMLFSLALISRSIYDRTRQ